jgi:Meiotically up-regulated gene 113
MGVFKRNGCYWIDYYHQGKRKREKISTDKKLAETVLRKRLVELAENVIDINDRRPIMQPIMEEALRNARLQTGTRKPFANRYLYFARCGDAVKIGVSDNPERRLREMQTGSPGMIVLLAVIKNAGHSELDCHRRLAHLHITGEWFRHTDEVNRLILELQPDTLWTPAGKV